MHLIYLDESGNTGKNLADIQQPVFVLGALVVPETAWRAIEIDLEDAIRRHAPESLELDAEIHGTDLRNGTGVFRGISVKQRLELRDAWLKIAANHRLQLVFRSVVKKRYERWLPAVFGPGVFVNPHLTVFPLVAQVVNHLLHDFGSKTLGIFIFDENREIVGDIERFQKLLRVTPGALQLDRIIEKGFFINSRKSRLLQLADLCILQARKLEERKIGITARSIDDHGIELVQSLVHQGRESWPDVIQWLQDVQSRK